MSLERKDVRAKLDPHLHAQLAVIADCDGKDLGLIVEEVLQEWVARRVHDATLLADKLGRLGITGNNRESQGTAGKTS